MKIQWQQRRQFRVMYAEVQVRNLKHSQSLAKEISPTGEDVNEDVNVVRTCTGSPISRQVKRHRRSCENFLIPLFQPRRIRDL